MQDKKVLIIGSNGYIGSSLFQYLSRHCIVTGIDIGWFDSPGPGHQCRDYRTLCHQDLEEFNTVVLLAGHSSVKMCNGPLEHSWRNNVCNWLELESKLRPDQLLVYASSGSVYGQGARADLTSFVPVNFYDLTKHVIDTHAARLLDRGRKLIGLRFGTVNGDSPLMRNDLMINKMVHDAQKYGTITVSNPAVIRPILCMQDLNRAIKSCICLERSGIFNLASFEMSVGEIAMGVAARCNVLTDRVADQASVYDFNMPIDEFCHAYNFKFCHGLYSCIDELLNAPQRKGGTRDQFVPYQ